MSACDPVVIPVQGRQIAAFPVPQRQVAALPILQGPAGVPGAAGGTIVTRKAEGAISGHRVVIARPGGSVIYADTSDVTHASLIEGVTTGAASDGADVAVQISGEMVEPSWSWTLGPVFVGASGQLTQSPPAGAWLKQIGTATAADTILINLSPSILTP